MTQPPSPHKFNAEFFDSENAGLTAKNPALKSDVGDGRAETSMALLQIQERNADELHPDIDRTNAVNLSRLIALPQSGWILARGRGPRNHERYLWCRGPITDQTEVLVHDCSPDVTATKCNNAWPASCFLQYVINYEIDEVRSNVICCPMCRTDIYNVYNLGRDGYMQDFYYYPADRTISAHIRTVIFGLEDAIRFAKQDASRLCVIEHDEVAKLLKFGRNIIIFRNVDAVKHPEHCDSTFVQQWIAVNWGNNEYRVIPMLPLPDTLAGSQVEAIVDRHKQRVTAQDNAAEAYDSSGESQSSEEDVKDGLEMVDDNDDDDSDDEV
ncbi:hypothetical protein LTR98_011749 [Exophiala xenobiotica]|nr:hypothetical protein LTR98_011749 [Exophiala xenobiotica]